MTRGMRGAGGGVQWFGRIDPPSVYQYQVSTDRAGTYRVYFNGGLHFTYLNAGWAPDHIEHFGEVWNYTGDQLAGDNVQYAFSQNIAWADLSTGWHVANSTFQQGLSNSTYPARTWDRVIGIGTDAFRLWDSRSP